MALKIRLRQQGKKNQYVYRLVLTDCRAPRDGKYIEMLGWYNPNAAAENNLHIQPERVQHWLDQGAELTERAKMLVQRGAPAVIEAYRKKCLAAQAKACEKKRTLRNKKKGTVPAKAAAAPKSEKAPAKKAPKARAPAVAKS